MTNILAQFGIDPAQASVIPVKSGLINTTWKIITPQQSFVLQKINTGIFKEPEWIADNISRLSDYAAKHAPEYLFTTTLKTREGQNLLAVNGDVYRVFPHIEHTHTIDVVSNPRQAYEAAAQFGKFAKIFSAFPAQNLHVTLPDFHNLSLRYKQFLHALAQGNEERIYEAADLIDELKGKSEIVATYENICADKRFKIRVTHHDTKISNVLFDDVDRGVCVIDLDTVMPGYFLSDVGDMMRTYLSPVSEEETDFSKIVIRPGYFQSIKTGYLDYMKSELSDAELALFNYSGSFLIYMQALRFLTDFLRNDVYYGEKYPGHNLVRAKNQAVLLQAYENFIYRNSLV